MTRRAPAFLLATLLVIQFGISGHENHDYKPMLEPQRYYCFISNLVAHNQTNKQKFKVRHNSMPYPSLSSHIPPTAYVTIATGQGTSGQIQQAGINSSIHIPPTAYVTIATGRGTYAQIQQAEISSNINMPPTSCVTSATGWGTYAQSSTRTSRTILILTKCETQTNEFISDQTNNSSMELSNRVEQPDSPPLLPMAPKTLLTHLLLFTTLALLSTLILLSLSDLYESCRYLYNPTYTVEHAKPRRRNATRKRNSSQRTGLESVKCARNSMKQSLEAKAAR